MRVGGGGRAQAVADLMAALVRAPAVPSLAFQSSSSSDRLRVELGCACGAYHVADAAPLASAALERAWTRVHVGPACRRASALAAWEIATERWGALVGARP